MDIILDALQMTTKAEAHAYLRKKLDFPAYYGNNLDALYDCLTELRDVKVVFEHQAEASGTYFDKVEEVFMDAGMVDITILLASGKNASMSAPGENFERLVRCMERAAAGGELTIGFIGGSITQGARASEDSKNYAYRCFRWWCDNFPKATFHYVNGGIGGTCSYFGTARVCRDLLRYQPDVVVVDFSVNDVGDNGSIPETVPETYEGLLRKILGWTSEPAVIALYNVFYDTGETVEPVHRRICEYYGIPGAGMKETVYRRLQEGEFEREYISPDGLHPNDTGHEMVAAEICKIFESARNVSCGLHNVDTTGDVECGLHNTNMTDAPGGLESHEESSAWELPAPLTANRYEDAVLWNISNCQPKLDGFRADASEKAGHLDCFKNGWIGKKKGDKITFTFACESLAVQYRKTINKPSPIARLIIDGDAEHAVILDGNFEEDWGDCLYLQRILCSEPLQEHIVEIEIIEAADNDSAPFYLLSIITA